MKFFKTALHAITIAGLLLGSNAALAGVDIVGPIQRLHVSDDGTLWFAMDTTNAQTYCKPGWHSLTMDVPANHPIHRT